MMMTSAIKLELRGADINQIDVLSDILCRMIDVLDCRKMAAMMVVCDEV